jgi:hypothetical protein
LTINSPYGLLEFPSPISSCETTGGVYSRKSSTDFRGQGKMNWHDPIFQALSRYRVKAEIDFSATEAKERRLAMQDEPNKTMTAENVEEFDVWVFNSRDLVVSVLPVHAPWSAATENYEINQSTQ